MAKTNKIEDNLYSVGEVSYDDRVTFKFKIRDDYDFKLQYIESNCSCISLIFDESDPLLIKGNIFIPWTGVKKEKGLHSLSKTITAVFSDNEDEYISQEKTRKKIPNPNKQREKLTIVGIVKI